METVLAQKSTEHSNHEGVKMMDYSEYLLRIDRLMRMMHQAAQANNNQAASDIAAEVARYAISLAAFFESKTETVI
jgi:hypothetical protein